MHESTAAQQKKALFQLVFFHISTITVGNYLVQFPSRVFGIFTTQGAFSFPFIFFATDLAVCILGVPLTRQITFWVMFPVLLLSYVLSVLSHDGNWTGWASLTGFNTSVGRTVLASFSAYVPGQILDTFVLNRSRRLKSWWIASTAFTIVDNALDTLVSFAVALYASNDEFMAANWQGIAFANYLFKFAICTLFFLPAYGIVLNILTKKLASLNVRQEVPESVLAK